MSLPLPWTANHLTLGFLSMLAEPVVATNAYTARPKHIQPGSSKPKTQNPKFVILLYMRW